MRTMCRGYLQDLSTWALTTMLCSIYLCKASVSMGMWQCPVCFSLLSSMSPLPMRKYQCCASAFLERDELSTRPIHINGYAPFYWSRVHRKQSPLHPNTPYLAVSRWQKQRFGDSLVTLWTPYTQYYLLNTLSTWPFVSAVQEDASA